VAPIIPPTPASSSDDLVYVSIARGRHVAQGRKSLSAMTNDGAH